MKQQRLVVIGNGMAGMRTVEALLSAAPEVYQITVFGAEPHGNYNRILLPQLLSGECSLDDIVIHDRAWYQANGIRLHTGPGKAVTRIERGLGKVVTQDGTEAAYDRLLIATGSLPIMPAIPGSDLQGVMAFRTAADAEQLLQARHKGERVVVIGGGVLGLEAASALAACGLEVTVVHNHPSIMNRQLDAAASDLLRAHLQQQGVRFALATTLTAIVGDDRQRVQAVHLRNQQTLPCDRVVMAMGVQPNHALAKRAGLYCERGIVVNDTLQTYDPCVYAVGECVQHRGATFGIVAPLYAQAQVCANHLSQHGAARFVPVMTPTQPKIQGIQLVSIGTVQPTPDTEEMSYRDAASGCYKKLLLIDNRLQGAVLWGDTADVAWYQQLITQQTPLAECRQQVMFGASAANAVSLH